MPKADIHSVFEINFILILVVTLSATLPDHGSRDNQNTDGTRREVFRRIEARPSFGLQR
jgi:hypothetical protein